MNSTSALNMRVWMEKSKIKGSPISSYCDYYENMKNIIKRMHVIIADTYKNEKTLFTFINNKDKLCEIYRQYLKGNLQSASNKMRNFLYSDNFLNNLINSIDKDKHLYRCRKKEGIEYEKFDYELFHVPYNKRYLLGNYRFSIPGFPCLYLSDSPECCLSELDCNDVFCAEFTLQNTLQCYDFTFNKKYCNLPPDIFLKYFILILFCEIQIKKTKDCDKDKAKYIPFYTIPQLVTAAIMAKKDSIRCIKYNSTKFDAGINYAFFPQVPDLRKNIYYDEKLKSLFNICKYNIFY